MGASSEPRQVRCRPGLRTGLLALAAYTVLTIGIQLSSGLSYEQWFDTVAHVLRGPLPAFAAGAVFLIGFAGWSRWGGLWREQRPRLSMGFLLWAPAVLTVLSTLALVSSADWSQSGSLVAVVVLTTALIGLCEELLFRGILLRGMRERYPEVLAALLSSALFGLFHLVNLALGVPAGESTSQVVSAGFAGFSYYLLRRGTGLLLVPIVVHAAYDAASTLTPEGEHVGVLLATALTIPTWILTVVAAVVLLVRKDRNPDATDRPVSTA